MMFAGAAPPAMLPPVAMPPQMTPPTVPGVALMAQDAAAAAAAAAASEDVRLSDGLLQNLAVGKVYRDHKGGMTGMDFTHDGLNLVTCGEDNSVFVYNCERAQRTRHLRCEKYGVSLLKFLHNDKDGAVAASRNTADHLLKYWDFHQNRYIRLFRGHGDKPTSLSPHPYEDIFLTGSEDKTVMLWDLRQDRPTAKINGSGPTLATFDQQGLVFAASVGRPKIHLFDTRNYAKGEFASFELAAHLRNDGIPRHLQFSPCGKYLLARTNDQLVLIDAFNGELICEYPVEVNNFGVPPAPGFSPDSQYVISGIPGGETRIWATTSARLVKKLSGHTAAPSRVAFNPAHALVVTAAETLAWWIPDTQ